MSSQATQLKDIFSIVSGILGVAAFLWKFWDVIWSNWFAHLQMDLEVDNINDFIKITTYIENKGSTQKKIDYAFLLVSPEKEDFECSLNRVKKISQENAKESTVFESIAAIMKSENQNEIYSDGTHVFIPIPYYYIEQVDVGNEKLKYACSILKSQLIERNNYTIRFVFVNFEMFKTYLRYRWISDLLIM